MLQLCLFEGKNIRGKKTPDGDWYSVYDFINLACNKNIKDSYGPKTFERLKVTEYGDELRTSCQNLKFDGRGQRSTPVMTVRGLQRLLMILGGKVAAEYRAMVESTFTRVMAGDLTLIQVIEDNAESNEPIHQLARDALAQEPVAAAVPRANRKRQRMTDVKLEINQQQVVKVTLDNLAQSVTILERIQNAQFSEATRSTLEHAVLVVVRPASYVAPPLQPNNEDNAAVSAAGVADAPAIPEEAAVIEKAVPITMPNQNDGSNHEKDDDHNNKKNENDENDKKKPPYIINPFFIFWSAVINSAMACRPDTKIKVDATALYNNYYHQFFRGFTDFRSAMTTHDYRHPANTGVYITKRYLCGTSLECPPDLHHLESLLSVQNDYKTMELIHHKVFWPNSVRMFALKTIEEPHKSSFVFVPSALKKILEDSSTPDKVCYDPEITLSVPLEYTPCA